MCKVAAQGCNGLDLMAHELAYDERQQRTFIDLNKVYTEDTLSLDHRQVVVDFMRDVWSDLKAHVSIEALRAALIYFDRYMSSRSTQEITEAEVELMSLTCLVVGIKYMETRVVSFEHMVRVSGSRYTLEDFVAAELLLLSAIDWNLHICNSHDTGV